jgi:Fe-S cluster assembly protein SufD
MEESLRLGIPGRKHEEWKYTPVDTHRPLEHMAAAGPETSSSAVLPGMLDGSIRIVFRNGYFEPFLSSSELAASGIKVTSLAKTGETCFEPGTVAEIHGEHFIALNSALARDGAVICIAKNARPEAIVEIVHLSEGNNIMSSPRLMILAGKGSEATIVETYISAEESNTSWSNAVAEIKVEENAILKFAKLQLNNLNSIQTDYTKIVQESSSTFNIITVTLGGKLVRNNLHIRHAGTNCTSHLFGLYIADGDQLIDNHSLVDHAMPNCFSNELYKGILSGKSTGVFNGKIFVRKDAQKTNAYQSNKTILLSDDAQMNAKPQLEIFADDVKCTHGATTGQLDDEALFYLRARGIGEQTARTLLNLAFAEDVLNNISHEQLRERMSALVTGKLHAQHD